VCSGSLPGLLFFPRGRIYADIPEEKFFHLDRNKSRAEKTQGGKRSRPNVMNVMSVRGGKFPASLIHHQEESDDVRSVKSSGSPVGKNL